MVVSKLNKQLKYVEHARLEKEDEQTYMDLYEANIHGKLMCIAVGSPRAHKEYGITHYPIYLIGNTDTDTNKDTNKDTNRDTNRDTNKDKDETKAVQIGVYETLTSRVSRCVNVNGTMNLSCFSGPLLYSFATPSFVQSMQTKKKKKKQKNRGKDKRENKEKEKEQENVIPSYRADIFVMNPDVSLKSIGDGEEENEAALEETKEMAAQIREEYKRRHSTSKIHQEYWMQTLMQNPYYEVYTHTNKDMTLFAAVVHAFDYLGQHTTAERLKEKLANHVPLSYYQQCKTQYNQATKEMQHVKKKVTEYNKQRDRIKDEYTQVVASRMDKRDIEQRVHLFKLQGAKLQQVLELAKHRLKEVEFMRDMPSFEGFKLYLQTPSCRMNEYLLHELEQMLHVKFVVMCRDMYNAGDVSGILLCPSFKDEWPPFKPDFYVLIDMSDDFASCQLMTYKQRPIFTFPTLPFDLKRLIVDKCFEHAFSPFLSIPQFKLMHHTKKQVHFLKSKDLELELELERELELQLNAQSYNEDIVFQVFEHSSGHPKPGKGAGERIPDQDLLRFATLASIPDWRRKLSPLWMQPFKLDELTWPSVEHYYQASKFKHVNHAFYYSFSVESNSPLSMNPELVTDAGAVHSMRRNPSIHIDPDFDNNIGKAVFAKAEQAKFTQHADLRHVLLQTKNAMLMLYRKGKAPRCMTSLMRLRLQWMRQLTPDGDDVNNANANANGRDEK